MKNYLICIFCILVITVSCKHSSNIQQDLFINENEVEKIISDGRIYTLNELKQVFMTEKGNFYDSIQTYRIRSYKYIGLDTLFLFSIDTLPKNGPGIYIRGRITTDDKAGNNYKLLIIQQIVDGKQQALRISVDMGSIGGMYARGQEILIRCNGLAIGRYANQPQLCVPTYNNNIYAQHAEEKIGWAPGRIPAPIFVNATHRIGLPEPAKIHYDEFTIDEIVEQYAMNDKCIYTDQKTVLQTARYFDGLAIVIRNLHCTGEYANTNPALVKCNVYLEDLNPKIGNPEYDPYANVFGPTTENIGYPQSRIFANADDDENQTSAQDRKVINLSTSEYAKYAHYYLPAKITRDPKTDTLIFDYNYYSGDIYGTLGFYYDNPKYDADKFEWSITPSSLNDLHLVDANGKRWIDNDAQEFTKRNK